MFGIDHLFIAATAAASASEGGLRTFRRWSRERRTAAALRGLDDAILKDIGIRRCEIPFVARTLAASSQEA